MSDPIAELRARTGEVHATFLLPERASERVFKRAYAKTKGVSLWRYSSLDRHRWFLTVMGEDKGRPEVEAVSALCEQNGGERYEPDPDMILALRERRWNTAIASTLSTGKDTVQRAHYGCQGALLDRSGQMHPSRRGQG